MTTTIQRIPRDLPAPTSAANVARRLALVLASQLGYREGRSASGDWNNDNAYGQYFGQNGVSWCNWFISWGAVAADIPATVIPRTGYTPASWNWFTSRNLDVTSPRAGDLFWVYGYVASEGGNRVHHIGFVEKVLSEGRIQTLEGNTNQSGSSQGNGVYRNVRTISSKLRFARPNYAAAIAIAKPPVAPPAKPVTPPIAVKPPVQEDDMPYTEAQLKTIAKEAAAEAVSEYMSRFWVAPTGTGTGIRAQLTTLVQRNIDTDAIAAAVVAKLPASGDIDQATVEAGVRAVLLDAATPDAAQA